MYLVDYKDVCKLVIFCIILLESNMPRHRLESHGKKIVNGTVISVLLGDIAEHESEVIVNSVDQHRHAYGELSVTGVK